MKILRIIVLLILTLAFFPNVHASNDDRHAVETPRAFVQGFYDWYVPKALAGGSAPAWNIALKAKSQYFTSELTMNLESDAKAQTEAEGEIVGLDFDPFLSNQDPGGDYEAGEVTKRGTSYCIAIYSLSSGNLGKNPVLVVEVVQRNGHWQFANFYYPNHLNLSGVLDALRRSREHASS